jgi:hypothetical protein
MTTRPAQHPRYLTEKRAKFLQLFRNTPHITTEQAYVLTEAQTATQQRATRRFLKLMSDAGFLLRELIVTKSTSPFPHFQYSYRLSKHGAKEVHKKYSAEKSPASLSHDSEITSFHIALQKYPGKLWWKQDDLKKTVYPDAVFGLAKDSASPAAYFFLEIEKSRQGHYRDGDSGLITKLKRYAAYRRSADCRREFKHFDDFRVVIIVANVERRNNLLNRLSVVLPQGFVWVTTESEYKENVLGNIFRTPKDRERFFYSFSDVSANPRPSPPEQAL